MKKRPIKKALMKLCAIITIFFLFIWTIWGNTALTVNNLKISSSRIPVAFSGFRIAQVSDLHNTEFGKGNKKLLELLSESKPDIITSAGKDRKAKGGGRSWKRQRDDAAICT